LTGSVCPASNILEGECWRQNIPDEKVAGNRSERKSKNKLRYGLMISFVMVFVMTLVPGRTMGQYGDIDDTFSPVQYTLEPAGYVPPNTNLSVTILEDGSVVIEGWGDSSVGPVPSFEVAVDTTALTYTVTPVDTEPAPQATSSIVTARVETRDDANLFPLVRTQNDLVWTSNPNGSVTWNSFGDGYTPIVLGWQLLAGPVDPPYYSAFGQVTNFTGKGKYKNTNYPSAGQSTVILHSIEVTGKWTPAGQSDPNYSVWWRAKPKGAGRNLVRSSLRVSALSGS
jgi:hypothetical protein